MNRFMHGAINFVIMLVAMFGIYSSQHGYATVITDRVLSWGGAIVISLGIATFWLYMVNRFPKATTSERRQNFGVMVLTCVIAFGTSSYWTIIAFGGRDAIRTHQDETLQAADRQALRMFQRQAALTNSAAQFNTLGDQFGAMAKFEGDKGGYSGTAGQGSVFNSALNMKTLLANVVKQTEVTDREYKRLYGDFKDGLRKARSIVSDVEKAEMTDQDKVRGLNLQFSGQLGTLNEITAQMAETSSDALLRSTVQSLDKLTQVSSPTDTPGQKSALEALQRIVDETRKLLGNVMGDVVNEKVDIQTFATMSPAQAVFAYFPHVFWAWFVGLGSDLFPLIFLFATSINRRSEEDDEAKVATNRPHPMRSSVG